MIVSTGARMGPAWGVHGACQRLDEVWAADLLRSLSWASYLTSTGSQLRYNKEGEMVQDEKRDFLGTLTSLTLMDKMSNKQVGFWGRRCGRKQGCSGAAGAGFEGRLSASVQGNTTHKVEWGASARARFQVPVSRTSIPPMDFTPCETACQIPRSSEYGLCVG